MAKIWRNRIVAGTQRFSDCPAKWQDDVKALLLEDVKDGTITQEEFDYLVSR